MIHAARTGPMANYNSKRKARQAETAARAAGLPARYGAWAVGIAVTVGLEVAAAALGVRAEIWIAAFGGIGGIAALAAAIGFLAHRRTLELAPLLWSGAILAINAVLAAAILAELALR